MSTETDAAALVARRRQRAVCHDARAITKFTRISTRVLRLFLSCRNFNFDVARSFVGSFITLQIRIWFSFPAHAHTHTRILPSSSSHLFDWMNGTVWKCESRYTNNLASPTKWQWLRRPKPETTNFYFEYPVLRVASSAPFALPRPDPQSTHVEIELVFFFFFFFWNAQWLSSLMNRRTIENETGDIKQ